MALQICIAAGFNTIITSSSDEKIAKLEKLSPKVHSVNYKTADIKAEVMKRTNGKGVDFVLNNAGVSSIPLNIETIRRSGSIALVGFLDGFSADYSPAVLIGLILKACKLQ